MKESSVRDFTDQLFSKEPVPGGGGAGSLVGALAVSLAGMVAGITCGKKGYEKFDEDMKRILSKTFGAKEKLLDLIEEDAKGYLVVSEVYKRKAQTEEEKKEKEILLEEALKGAAEPPLQMLRVLSEVSNIFFELNQKGSPYVLSDVRIGALFLDAAKKSAAMNVIANTRLMKDRDFANETEEQMRALLIKDREEMKTLLDSVEKIFEER